MMMSAGKMHVHPGDGITQALADTLRDRAAGKPILPFLIHELGDDHVLLSLYGTACRHLTIAEAREAAAQLEAAADRAESHAREAVAS